MEKKRKKDERNVSDSVYLDAQKGRDGAAFTSCKKAGATLTREEHQVKRAGTNQTTDNVVGTKRDNDQAGKVQPGIMAKQILAMTDLQRLFLPCRNMM